MDIILEKDCLLKYISTILVMLRGVSLINVCVELLKAPLSFFRLSDLLLSGAVMNTSFQPHEAHIPFPLQVYY